MHSLSNPDIPSKSWPRASRVKSASRAKHLVAQEPGGGGAYDCSKHQWREGMMRTKDAADRYWQLTESPSKATPKRPAHFPPLSRATHVPRGGSVMQG